MLAAICGVLITVHGRYDVPGKKGGEKRGEGSGGDSLFTTTAAPFNAIDSIGDGSSDGSGSGVDAGFDCIVTSNADTMDAGTLRWCIVEANSRRTIPTSITFDIFAIGSNQTTIIPHRLLPSINTPMTIDGGIHTTIDTRGDERKSVGIIIDGRNDVQHMVSGLSLLADDVVIRGLAIIGFGQNGVVVAGKRAKIQGEFLDNKEVGIFLNKNASDAVIGGGAIPTVIGGNGNTNIYSAAPRLWVYDNVFVGVSPGGRVLNKIDASTNYYGAGFVYGIKLTVTAIDSKIFTSNSGQIVIGGNSYGGIQCYAPRLTVSGHVYVGIMPNGAIVGNKGGGIVLKETAANARIGSDTVSTASGRFLVTNTIYISGNKGDGIYCDAPRLAVSNTWIGLGPLSGRQAALGNDGHGIRLGRTAIDARIGAAMFDECAQSGYMICTTATCCESTKVGLGGGHISFVGSSEDTLEDDHQYSGDGICEAAAGLLQLSSGFYTQVGDSVHDRASNPYGCFLEGRGLRLNKALDADKLDPCGSGWRAKGAACESAPAGFPILKCRPPIITNDLGSVFSDDPKIAAFVPPVYISANTGAGIFSEAPRLSVANTLVGLGPLGEHVKGVFGNNGIAGIVLEQSASGCNIGLAAHKHKFADMMESTVFISGNAGSGIRSSAPNLFVGMTVIGLDANRTKAGSAAAPNRGESISFFMYMMGRGT